MILYYHIHVHLSMWKNETFISYTVTNDTSLFLLQNATEMNKVSINATNFCKETITIKEYDIVGKANRHTINFFYFLY